MSPFFARASWRNVPFFRLNVSSENGSHLVEEFASPGGPYLSLGEEVDLEIIVRTFVDKNQQPCSRLRIARMVGEF
jgi:hypothetical protein